MTQYDNSKLSIAAGKQNQGATTGANQQSSSAPNSWKEPNIIRIIREKPSKKQFLVTVGVNGASFPHSDLFGRI